MKSQQPTHSLRFMFFLLLSSIGLLSSGIFLDKLSKPSQNLDNRTQAVGTGNPAVTISHSPQNPIKGQKVTINFNVDTGTYQTTGIQIQNVKTQSSMSLNLPSQLTQVETTLSPALNQFQANTINYLAILSNFNIPFTTNGVSKTIAKYEVVPTTPGTISILFNDAEIIMNEFGGNGSNLITQMPANKIITVSDGTAPTPSPTPTPTPTPTPSPTPTPNPTPTPSPTPTPEACAEPYAPQKVIARPGLNPGEINVAWVRPGGQDHFAVSFGKESGKYLWGSANIGNTRNFVIRYLEPGQKYYLAVATINSCGGTKFATELSAVARANPTNATLPSRIKPEVIPQDDDGKEIKPTPSPTPTPEPVIIEDEPDSANKTLLQRLLTSPLTMIIMGILLALFILSLIKRNKPPFPPKKVILDEPVGPHPQPPTNTTSPQF